MSAGFTTWSHSCLKDYRKCPKLAKHKYVDKLKPPLNHAQSVGIHVHECIASFIRGLPGVDGYLNSGVKYFRDYITSLQIKHKSWSRGSKDFMVLVEEDFTLDKNWKPTKFFSKEAWLRVRVDCVVIDFRKRTIEVLDWKTGVYNKELAKEYFEQLRLYGLAVALHLPKILELVDETSDIDPTDFKEVCTTLCYIDTNQRFKLAVNINDMAAEIDYWNKSIEPMFSDTEFKATPNSKCRYCPYNKKLPWVKGENSICREGYEGK